MAKTKAKAKAAKKTLAKKAKVAPKKKAAKKPAAKKAAKKPAASKPAASKAPAKKPAAKAAKKAAKKPAAKKVAKAPAATTKPARKSADLKTKPTAASVNDFLDSLDPIRAAECKELVDLMREATGVEPKMWGAAVVGFGDWHYKYDSGREGDFFQVGFSPRKGALTLYIVRGYENHADLLARLGKHSTGKSCLYVKRLADVDRTVLSELITRGVAEVVAGSKA